MANKDLMLGRNDGMAFALRIAERDGIEALRKEIEFRNLTGISLNVPQKDIKEAGKHMAMHATVTAIAISIDTLKEEFAFSNYQLNKFHELFNQKVTECCEDDTKLPELITRAELAGIKLVEY